MEASNQQPGFHGKQVRGFFFVANKMSINPTVGIYMDSLLFYGSRSDPQPVIMAQLIPHMVFFAYYMASLFKKKDPVQKTNRSKGHKGSTYTSSRKAKRTQRTTEVLSMKWVDDVVLGAPWKVSEELLTTMILRLSDSLKTPGEKGGVGWVGYIGGWILKYICIFDIFDHKLSEP